MISIFCLLTRGIGRAQEVVAVLSSDSQYYLEAFHGFQDAWGHPVTSFNMRTETPAITEKTQLVVAFGGKASSQRYPAKTLVVSCMTLVAGLKRNEGGNRYFYISMAPHPGLIFSKIKMLQPSLKRLAVFWTSNSLEDYIGQMRKAAFHSNVELALIKLDDPDALPEQLRNIHGEIDAIFLPPDPILVNVANFATIRDFSAARHIPFYAPTEGLAEKGATVSIASDFYEMGRSAALTARELLKDARRIETVIYPDKVRIAVNLTAAGNSTLQVTPELLQKADKVFP